MWETVEIIGLALIPVFMLLDLVVRHRSFRTAGRWRLRGVASTIVILAVTIATATMWASILGDASLLDLSGLGIAWGTVVGILVYELVHYTYHRAAHKSDLLWRYAHQMHHSAESLDAYGALYQHPLDGFFFATWSSLVFLPVLGLRPEAAVIAGAFIVFNAMFQHANIKTPRWLGYIIQRPESHGVHHQRGHHRSNYADLPLWDMVFGTFDNPETFDEEVGLYPGASTRVGDMLIGRDVSTPAASTVELAPHRDEKAPDDEPAALRIAA